MTCISVTSDGLTQAVEASGLILVAKVHREADSGPATLEPEAILKGSVPSTNVEVPLPEGEAPCELAVLADGTRALLFLSVMDGRPQWPGASQVFDLEDGFAIQQEDLGFGRSPEVARVNSIRSITGQYVVPAADSSEGAGIDWGSTVLPMGAVLLVVFGIGLVLMRTWHRIDPS
ncbi:MAG: hypothetical protein IH609_19230 [Dehalococcoidia bacterium]|nr:hypothetical protein [Dehalococcoidia bacterium]